MARQTRSTVTEWSATTCSKGFTLCRRTRCADCEGGADDRRPRRAGPASAEHLGRGGERDLGAFVVQHGAFGQRVLQRSEEHTSELQSRGHLVCRLLLEKKKDTSGFE